jgi:hypothetical protein
LLNTTTLIGSKSQKGENNTMSANIDLFEQWVTLPETMQNVLNKYADIEHDYNTLEAMQSECEALGYTFEWGLDCVPYDLQEIQPTVQQLSNGQYEVNLGNLTLIHTDSKGFKSNDCSEDKTDYVELCSQHDKRFKPLFIALHNFKSNQ